jgi:hypothetical protein
VEDGQDQRGGTTCLARLPDGAEIG